MAAITNAFLEAYYSRHGIEDREVQQARGHWERVRTALRKLSGGL
jgi:hypothetical protein